MDDVSYDYLTDSLGSVTHLVDQGGVVVKNTRYKPFGEVLTNAGSVRDPFYRWVGSWGYRATTLATATHYVRARSYDQRTGVWTVVDPTWPDEQPYSYVDGLVTKAYDPTGLRACQVKCPPGEDVLCMSTCESYERRYFNCTQWPGKNPGDYKILCECKCPDPIVTEDQAKDKGNEELKRRFAPCGKGRIGKPQPATSCPPREKGSHLTTTYQCKGGYEATVSIVCCECDNGKKTCKPYVKGSKKNERCMRPPLRLSA